MATPDWRELVIEHLNMQTVEVEDALVEARRDCDGWRQLALVALASNAELTKHNDRLRACVARQIEGDRLCGDVEAAA